MYVVGKHSTKTIVVKTSSISEAQVAIPVISWILGQIGIETNPFAIYTVQEWAR